MTKTPQSPHNGYHVIIFKSNRNSVVFGFTGHDEIEKGCASNNNRIKAMRSLKERGYNTWASIEPIIDIEISLQIIRDTLYACDHYKIGLLSGKKYDRYELINFIDMINQLHQKVYFKNSLLKQAGIERKDLPSNCVNENYF